MYWLCVLYHCHRVLTQLQLTNISIYILIHLVYSLGMGGVIPLLSHTLYSYFCAWLKSGLTVFLEKGRNTEEDQIKEQNGAKCRRSSAKCIYISNLWLPNHCAVFLACWTQPSLRREMSVETPSDVCISIFYSVSVNCIVGFILASAEHETRFVGASLMLISPLKTKRRPLHLKTQSVPRCNHISSRL